MDFNGFAQISLTQIEYRHCKATCWPDYCKKKVDRFV